MSDIILFVGATTALSSDLLKLNKMLSDTVVLAPAASQGCRGINQESILKARTAVTGQLSKDDAKHRGISRFFVWSYEPESRSELDYILEFAGRAAWIEFVPVRLLNKIVDTRLYIERQQCVIKQKMHEISHSVYARRKASPLPLPLKNFRSEITSELDGTWYRGRDISELKDSIRRLTERFRQRHAIKDGRSFSDDRSLLFKPANDGECHGKPHPTGSVESLVEGRFRFGAALFPGFHYDVRKENGTLDCVIYDDKGAPRDMKSEKRVYLNIFPNDFLLPK